VLFQHSILHAVGLTRQPPYSAARRCAARSISTMASLAPANFFPVPVVLSIETTGPKESDQRKKPASSCRLASWPPGWRRACTLNTCQRKTIGTRRSRLLLDTTAAWRTCSTRPKQKIWSSRIKSQPASPTPCENRPGRFRDRGDAMSSKASTSPTIRRHPRPSDELPGAGGRRFPESVIRPCTNRSRRFSWSKDKRRCA